MDLYLVDYVLGEYNEGQMQQELSLGLIAVGKLAPFAIVHVVDFRDRTWGIGGQARKALQTSLLQKILELDSLVAHGYRSMLLLVQESGRIIILLLYQFLVPLILRRPLK